MRVPIFGVPMMKSNALPRTLLSAVPTFTALATFAQLTWQRTYGGYGSDEGMAVVATADSGYAFLGSTGSFGSGGDAYLVRVDSAGALLWSRSFGGSGVDRGADLVAAADGGFLVVGSTYTDPQTGYDGLLVRTDAQGAPVWEKAMGGTDWDLFHAAAVTADGWFVVGRTYGIGSGAAWVLRLNAQGDTLWTRAYAPGPEAWATAVVATPDGGCVVLANTEQAADRNIVLLRYAADGTVDGVTTWGGTAIDEGRSLSATADGGFVVGGITEGVMPYRTMLLLKFDGGGNALWSEVTYGQGHWEGHGVIELANGELCMAGSTDAFGAGGKDMYMWHTTATGAYLEGPTFGGLEQDEAFDVTATLDGGYVLIGRTTTTGPGPQAMAAVKHFGSPLSGGFTATFDPLPVPEVRPDDSGLHVRPNPARPGEAVVLTMPGAPTRHTTQLLDQQGRTVAHWPAASASEPLPLPPLAPGIYRLCVALADGRRVVAPLCIVP